jgi:hypothetical protein
MGIGFSYCCYRACFRLLKTLCSQRIYWASADNKVVHKVCISTV